MKRRIRYLLRVVGTPVRLLLVGLIAAYRFLTSGLAPHCKYYPSCSAYAETALRTHGVVRGLMLAVWRVLRCNPLSNGGVDHVPEVWAYDTLIQRRRGASVR